MVKLLTNLIDRLWRFEMTFIHRQISNKLCCRMNHNRIQLNKPYLRADSEVYLTQPHFQIMQKWNEYYKSSYTTAI